MITKILLILLFVLFSLPQKGFSQEEVNYHNTLALTLVKKGMLDEAISEWKKVVSINPSLAVPHYNLGLAYQKKGMLKKAITEYRKALELNGGYTLAYYNLGNAYYQEGLYRDAYSQWQKVIELDPNDESARNNLKVAQGLLAKQPFKPVLTLRGLQKGQPGGQKPGASASRAGVQEYFDKGVESLKEGRVDEAIEYLEKVVKADPNFPQAYSELGRAYHKKRMLRKARVAYKKALAQDPGDKKTRFLLNVLR